MVIVNTKTMLSNMLAHSHDKLISNEMREEDIGHYMLIIATVTNKMSQD